MKNSIKSFTLIAAAIAITSCGGSKKTDVNIPADVLENNLISLVEQGKIMYGHQDDLMYGHSWKLEDDASEFVRSDVKEVCGKYPAVLGLDLGGIEMGWDANLDRNDFDNMRASVVAHHERGGITTFSWHPRNPLTGGDAWDVSSDQVVASIHYLGDTDPFFGSYFRDKDWKQAYGGYLETLYNEMSHWGDFDIMGHYDYVVRYWDYEQVDILYKDFPDVFDEIFRYLIHNGKALEINTKSYQNYHGRRAEIDNNVLLRYKEMGGEIISFGSDSHDAHVVGHDFEKYAALAKSLGFRWSAHYEKRKLVQLPL